MVPVLDKDKRPLMPCSEKRARKLLERKEAKPYWFKGIFCIILQREPKTRYQQKISIGIDPGSKMSGLTILSEKHTLLNVQYNASTHVKGRVEDRALIRRIRRQNNTPYRKCRFNKRMKDNWIPPSTLSRWRQHLNLIKHFSKLYKITDVAFEDIKARTIKGAKKWNKTFSPLQGSKNWFYNQVEKSYNLHLYQGFDTYRIRVEKGLKKGTDKMKVSFESHCVDSWTIANDVLRGMDKPENERLTHLKPLIYYRRKLHEHVPAKKGIRRPYGGTISLGFKRGSLVKHPKYGICIIGGTTKGRLSLHDLFTNKRLCQNAKPEDITILTNIKWNIIK